MHVKVHQDPQIESLIDLYADLLSESSYQLPIRDHLEQLAARLKQGHKDRHPALCFMVGKKLGKPSLNDVFTSEFSEANAKECLAQDFGYDNWDCVLELGDLKPDADFESLVDKMLAGDSQELKAALARDPELVHRCSTYPHKATLLHYTGSNGVEWYRQVVPMNLVEIVDMLLLAGADMSLQANVYGGCTAEELMKTSKHPYESALYEPLQKVFDEHKKRPA